MSFVLRCWRPQMFLWASPRLYSTKCQKPILRKVLLSHNTLRKNTSKIYFWSSCLFWWYTSYLYGISVHFSSVAQSCLTLWPNGLQTARPLCPSSTLRAYSNLCPLHRLRHPTISSSVIFSSSLQSFPALGYFSNELVLHIRWTRCWSFNFSISPSNEVRTDLL